MTSAQSSTPAADGGWDGATWCCEVELSGTPALAAVRPHAGQRRARVLARVHGEPVGYLTVPCGPDGVSAASAVAAARDQLADGIAEHLAADGLAAPPDAELPPAGPGCVNAAAYDESVSVVVCTRDRSTELVACLDRLRTLTHPRLEIVVVDNAPSDDGTRRVVEEVARTDARFRYVCEPRPGLSPARNRGWREATGDIVAYTDDDVAVDADWVHGLLRGRHRRPDVGCVTGLVATAGIDSPAEEYFDARAASWSTRARWQLFEVPGRGPQDALYPYSAGVFGTGANFAFDRSLLAELGGFDEALGAGTLTKGGEDLDVFVRVLRAGRPIVYEPAAVVWHHHRADEAALLRQLYGYGTGLTAYLTKLLATPGTRSDVLRRVPLGLRRMTRIGGETSARLQSPAAAPKGALLQEWRGFAAGPLLYWRARRALRREPAGHS